ncbi:MAG: hypothetical protein AB7P69_19815 [Candidatus Binatia bacterium]
MKNLIHTPMPAPEGQDYRCYCGNLLARMRREGVELKCRRCKRIALIPWEAAATGSGFSLQWQEITGDERWKGEEGGKNAVRS